MAEPGGAPAIAAAGLAKHFGDHVAVRGLTFEVAAGDVVGLLGPNGAGKTTTVKMLLGLTHPTAGAARLFGTPVADPASRRRVGYLPELFRFPPWLTGRQVVRYHARLAGVARADEAAEAERLLALVGLDGRGGERVASNSKGMSQRLGLAQALVGDPALVILDEPTSALDPLGRRDVREVIAGLRRRGVAVLLNSHLLGEVEAVCDRVVIMNHGAVVYAGSPAELHAGQVRVELTLDRVDEAALGVLGRHGSVAHHDDTTAVVVTDERTAAARIARDLLAQGYDLYRLVPQRQSLEDVFVGVVSQAAPDGPAAEVTA